MAKKIEVTEELIALNPEALKEAKVGDKVDSAGLTLPVQQSKEEDTVKVEKATLEKILSTMEALQQTNEKLVKSDEEKDKKIELLLNIADKSKLYRYETQNNNGELIRKAKIAFWNDKPVIGWQTVKDEVGFRDGKMQVSQITRIFMQEEGKDTPASEDLEYLYWVQNTICKEGEVVSKTENNSGKFWTIQFKDGRKITVDIRFVNPF